MAKKSKGRSSKLPAKQQEALAALITCYGSTSAAAKVTGISQSTIWRYTRDEAFAAEYAAAKDEWYENLLAVAYSRALKTSNTLLIFLLKSARPELFDDAIRKLKYERKDFEENKDKFVLPRIEVNIIPKLDIDYNGSAMVDSRSDQRSDN